MGQSQCETLKTVIRTVIVVASQSILHRISAQESLKMHTQNTLNALKRSAAETGPVPKRSAWQQPVSCEFCRLKKLRCDKKRPCYNCASRGFACEYASGKICSSPTLCLLC